MLDLKLMTEDFVRDHFSRLCLEGLDDQTVLRAVDESNMNMAAREDLLLTWLHSYKVLLFFPPENSRLIARQILRYADNERTATRSLDKDAILAEYQKLGEILSAAAPRTKSGSIRNVGSLTSKALWCCYPADIPIIDDHAERALQVISRLAGIKPTKSGRYEQFIEVWFLVYDRIASVIDAADLKGYRHKIRVLDMLLWHLGQPSFDVAVTA